MVTVITPKRGAPQVSTKIIGLPDLRHAYVARAHCGWGTAGLKIALNADGTLASFGTSMDSKGPQTISAIASLATAAAAAFIQTSNNNNNNANPRVIAVGVYPIELKGNVLQLGRGMKLVLPKR